MGGRGGCALAGLRDLGFLSASAARVRSFSSTDSGRVTSSCDMATVLRVGAMRCDVDGDGVGVGDGDGELEGGTECTKGQGKRRPGRTRDTLLDQSKHRVAPTAYNRQSVLLDDVGLFLEHSLIGIRIE